MLKFFFVDTDLNSWTWETIGRYTYLLLYFFVLWQVLTKMVNSILSNLIEQESHGNYKKTQQGVPNVFLSYLYIVYANDK